MKRSPSKKGHIIVIVAPSGSGKSTLIKKIKHTHSILEESISCTTRPMRKNERQGEDYFFMDKKTFIAKRERGEFLEWACVHSHYYGTPKDLVVDMLTKGKTILFDLDVQGTKAVKKKFKNQSTAIFIAPPSLAELKKRLLGRGTEDALSMKTRLGNAKEELKEKDCFDHLVKNDNFERAFKELNNLFKKILDE